MFLDGLLVLSGAAILMLAADRLVLSTGNLASRVGVSPVVVGAVVIGFGSSLPEMLVSLAALDQPNGLDLAVGNVIGSNIANVGLVLGTSVLFFPFSGTTRVIRREGLLMLGSLILLSVFLADQRFDRLEGAILVMGLVGAGFAVVAWSKPDSKTEVPAAGPRHSTKRLAVRAVAALVVLALAARVLVIGAEGLAVAFGISEGLVGLTILALGTSLPELVTVLASARRQRSDLVLGNVLGSNMFNALGVAGLTGLIGAGRLATNFGPDLVVMIGIAVLAGAAAWSGNRYRRVEGALMLSSYPAAVWVAI